MIIPFLTDEQFVSRLSLFIFVYVLICITMAYCAKRQPTDYDTLWMRRWRIISGVSWIILAVGSIFVYNHFPLQFYCQNVYGTVMPTQDMITTGISPYLPMHNPEHALVWGRLTFRQWQIETNVSNILRYLSLGIYFILFKPSSVNKWVKVRKFIGYVLLLFFFPATINFRYFDMLEIIPVLVVLLIVYLLLRTYKHDAIVPVVKEPLKTSDGSIIEEFAPIAPEEKVKGSQESVCNEDKAHDKVRVSIKEKLRNSYQRISDFLCHHWEQIKAGSHHPITEKSKTKTSKKTNSKISTWLAKHWKKAIIFTSIIVVNIAVIIGAYKSYVYYTNEYLPQKRYQEAVDKVLNDIHSSEDGKRIYYWLILSKDPEWNIPEIPNGTHPYKLSILRQEAFDWYESKAYSGDPEYQISLATLYDFGEEMFYVEENQKRAAYWYEQSALQDFVPAYLFIGLCYRDGEGVAKDLKKAFDWFEKGSNANEPHCQYYLANMYEQGIYIPDGVHYERVKVYDYEKLRSIYENGLYYERVARIWDDNKMDWYTIYKHQVNDYKCILTPDINKAKELWRKSAAQGNQDAKEKLEQIYD